MSYMEIVFVAIACIIIGYWLFEHLRFSRVQKGWKKQQKDHKDD